MSADSAKWNRPLSPSLWRSVLLLGLAMLLAAGVAAAQTKHPITVEDLWAVRRVGAPSLSPDGRWAAVEVTTYDMQENSGTSDIWLLATDGSSQRQLTTHPARDSSPLWSPDGKRIAFLSRREGDEQTQIYLISPEGGEARRLTKISTGASAAKWFPDSKRIAFVSWVWPDLKTDEAQARRLKEQRESKVKAYVIDTTKFRHWDHWLAHGRVPHLFVIDIEAGQTADVLAGTGLSLPRFPFDPSSDLYDISPDGGEIALTTDLSKDLGFELNADIVTISLQDRKWTNITADNPADDTSPRYSPDGKWIAYLKQTSKYFYRMALYERSTAAKRVVMENWDRSPYYPVALYQPTWSPDSRRLYFSAEDKARFPIWVLELGEAAPRPIVEGGTNLSFDLSRDGRMLAFVRTTMGTPPTLFAAAADGTSVRRIESFNDELVAQWNLGEVKEIVYKGWGDEPVQMWVIYPPNFDPKKKWPLLQQPHGFPGATLDLFHFRWNNHLLASRGYVVAAVNFHGSSGWGEAFNPDSVTGHHGTKELEDIEKATDLLLATGYIDPDRLAAAGGSGGGTMVAWMNGHTNRYKAFVCHAGGYDRVSQMMTSDMVRWGERAAGAFPWENPPKVLEQSPHWYAKNFKTPTLITHGEQDFRNPVTQAFEYYATLRMLGVPTRLLYFPDEGHFILKPQNSRLWHKEFFDWLEKYAPSGPS